MHVSCIASVIKRQRETLTVFVSCFRLLNRKLLWLRKYSTPVLPISSTADKFQKVAIIGASKHGKSYTAPYL